MSDNQNGPDLTIIGGGITGLTAAFLAAEAGKTVRLIEASEKLGGLLNTFPIGGNRLEFYYHHFFTHDAEVNWLLEKLNLTDDLIFQKTTMGVFRNGKIYDFNSPSDLLKFSPLNIFDKFRFAATSVYLGKFAQWRNFESVGAMQWFRRWAGKGTCEALWDPLLRIKFGPFADKVPLAWMIGRLRQRMSSRKGSGDERLGYIDGSLQKLSDALEAKLRTLGVEIVTKAAVTELKISDDRIVGINTKAGNFPCKDILFTIPTIYLHPLLEPIAPDYADSLKTIEYFGAVCTILELDRPFSHIYWLNIADPDYPFGGLIEHTNFIPPEKYNNSHILYLSRYFAHSENLASMSQEEIKNLMLPHLKNINPDFEDGWIKTVHVFKTMTAATVCDLNFSAKVPRCKTPISNAYMANMCHIYPDERSVNNSIRIAAEACRVMNIQTDKVPANLSLSGQIGME